MVLQHAPVSNHRPELGIGNGHLVAGDGYGAPDVDGPSQTVQLFNFDGPVVQKSILGSGNPVLEGDMEFAVCGKLRPGESRLVERLPDANNRLLRCAPAPFYCQRDDQCKDTQEEHASADAQANHQAGMTAPTCTVLVPAGVPTCIVPGAAAMPLHAESLARPRPL